MELKKNIRLQTIALVTGVFIFCAKLAAWWYTQSNAILTDALESIINVIAGAFALYSIYLAYKPRDLDHPYGHGKIEFISAALEGFLISVAGVIMMIKAIYNFIYPIDIHQIDLGLYIVAASGILNYILGFMLEQRGKKSNSLILIADGKHLKSDAYSTVGLVIGLTLILVTGWNWLDNLTAIIFGLIIIFTGWQIIRKSVAGIMDEADYEIIEQLISVLRKNRADQWIDIHNLRTIKYGNMLHIDCHMTMPWYYNLQQAHTEQEKILKLISKELGGKVELFIHVDPCVEQSCSICQLKECNVRKKPFEKLVEWEADTLLPNKKHKVR